MSEKKISELNQIPLNEILDLKASPDGKRGKYCCPACGSGTHGRKGTGELVYNRKRNTWTCWACHRNAFDIVAQAKGFILDGGETDFKRTLDYLREGGWLSAGSDLSAPEPHGAALLTPPSPVGNISGAALDYLRRRGFDNDQLLTRFLLGYSEDFIKDEQGRGIGRIYIPLTADRRAWVARRIDGDDDHKYRTTPTGESDSLPLWYDGEYLTKDFPGDCVFIVEGVLDTLALAMVGQPSIPLLGKSRWTKLRDHLKEHGTSKRLVLALDNEENVREGEQAQLAAALDRMGIDYTLAVYDREGIDDPCEYLEKDREGFCAWVEREAKREGKFPDMLEYLETGFAADCKKYKESAKLKTGFANTLDDMDNGLGGFYPGLYVLGANPGIGKTTLALQLADNVARQGKHSLFITLEQSKRALLSKTLSRLSFLDKATRENRARSLYHGEISEAVATGKSPEGKEDIETILGAYKKLIGGRTRIIEEIGERLTIRKIENMAHTLADRGELDFLVVDYLQLLDDGEGKEDRQRLTFLAERLKALSHALDIPVLALSAVSRQNYYKPITLDSFKESGGIEYGAFCVMGLYLAVLDGKPSEEGVIADYEEAMRGKADGKRDLILNCVKTKEHSPFAKTHLTFYPGHASFED